MDDFTRLLGEIEEKDLDQKETLTLGEWVALLRGVYVLINRVNLIEDCLVINGLAERASESSDNDTASSNLN